MRDYELVLGAGDYTGGSTGDSGYGEAESWKQHMTNPPVDRKGECTIKLIVRTHVYAVSELPSVTGLLFSPSASMVLP